MGWADAIRGMKVRANAETVVDTSMARRFGAEGIGLSRTEHMFFEADRIGAMRRVIRRQARLGRRGARLRLGRASDACGLPGVHPHMLRHSCGYYMADRHEEVRVMQDWLGHANVQNTVRYTTLAPGRLGGAKAPG